MLVGGQTYRLRAEHFYYRMVARSIAKAASRRALLLTDGFAPGTSTDEWQRVKKYSVAVLADDSRQVSALR